MQKQTNKADNWENLTITNRFIFNKVFTNNPDACRQLLEILLGMKIARIQKPQGEFVIEGNIENHAVRFDIFTKDKNQHYDVEMQTTIEDDLPERARYYQAMMDVDSLESGKPYKDLKNSIVIFICTFDPFKKQRPKYEFRNLDIHDRETELGDRTTKIFFNVNEYDKIQDDEALKSLLKYFSQNKSEDGFTDSLTNLVKIAKKNERWRQDYMTYERWQYYERQHGIKEGYEEGVQTGIAQGISQGIAKQKAEDEKRIASQALEIAELKAQLAKLTQNKATRN